MLLMVLRGYAGNILFVDLSSATSFLEPTSGCRDFIGGRGTNQWLLFKLLDRADGALAPENVIILGAGPLVGTLVPAASRLSVDFKNVITGGVGSANCGGHFAAEMKFAGYDHIVITGKSPAPVYLYIENGEVHFRDARDLWGKDTWTTENAIKVREDNSSIKTLTIGPAGENLVSFACIIGDRGRAAGYGGGGAVFGSKNLKAVAVAGGRRVEIAHPDKFISKVRDFYAGVVQRSNMVKIHREGGTLRAYELPGENRPHGVRNMSDEFWPDEAIRHLSREKVDKYLIRRHSCFGCPVYCSGIYQWNGLKFEGLQANMFRAFGSNLDVRDVEVLVHANALVNLYGLDCDHTSAAIAWAIECFENGVISTDDTGGLELRWGKGENIIRLIRDIAYRRGFGDILARGVYDAAKHVGRGSERYAVLVKKNALMEAAMRSHKAWALGIITSTKGGGHLRGAPGQEFQNIPPEASKKLFGIDDVSDPVSYENKASLVVWQESYKGLIDIMGICALATMWMDTTLFFPRDIADFYYFVTGEEISPDELLRTGSRLQELERSFNLLHAGFGRAEDMPPDKLVNIPVSGGRYKGQRLDAERWNAMLDEYYTLHGWDVKTGWPTYESLTASGLGHVADKLRQAGLCLRQE